MSLLVKGATIQVRVTPAVKAESERVLRGIGLNMSEAVELFLRRLIVDARIPFEVVALDSSQLNAVEPKEVSSIGRDARIDPEGHPIDEKIQKVFSRGHAPKRIRARKRGKGDDLRPS